MLPAFSMIMGMALLQSAVPPVSATPAAEETVIVIYRGSSVTGAALGCPVRFHERELVELGRGKFAEWRVAPGRYILTNKTSSVQVIAVAGERSYVRCAIKMGMLTGRADLQIADEESFTAHSADYTRKEIANAPGLDAAPKP